VILLVEFFAAKNIPSYKRGEMMLFRDRIHAGQVLGDELKRRGMDSKYLVLALPRGGVPIAFEIVQKIDAQMDVFVVRKLGVPGREELAMGAIGPGHSVVLNQDIIDRLGISKNQINEVINREEKELLRRIEKYRTGRRPLELAGRRVILVDDGLATGASMRVACQAIKQHQVDSLCVAVPVGAQDSCNELKEFAGEVICVHTPEPFYGVGHWYDNFSQTSDEEVIKLMEVSARSNNFFSAS